MNAARVSCSERERSVRLDEIPGLCAQLYDHVFILADCDRAETTFIANPTSGYYRSVASWTEFAAAEPELAARGHALLYQRGDGEGFLTTVAANGTPRIHPLNVGVVDGRLLVFVQDRSAKARDLKGNARYALHAHQDPDKPSEFLVRGTARLVTDADVRDTAAGQWFFTVSKDYPLYELLIDHALLGERAADEWPPRYRSWRSTEAG